ncbi:CoA-binding protein [Aestuariivirga litoralis]|uniref:CoA-binding protein n=1 Tax=Aestuariivirga litoralis TaxID=2650924 RepID=UPI0018C85DEA|nr:CoA-binding protein [Aestuariivirga litoralis]MBG1231778.1 CoA-binding protein [Aestuariivirga litoralis]
MNHASYDDDYIRGILTSVKTIALVGASPKPERPSYGVMRFLLGRGYDVVPVNPGLAGQQIHGKTVVATLADLPHPVDMVDVFRNSSEVPKLVDEVLALATLPKVIWMQLGVSDTAAAALAQAKSIKVVMNRCPAIEIPRLHI